MNSLKIILIGELNINQNIKMIITFEVKEGCNHDCNCCYSDNGYPICAMLKKIVPFDGIDKDCPFIETAEDEKLIGKTEEFQENDLF